MIDRPDRPRAEFQFENELPDPYRAPVNNEGQDLAPYPIETAGAGRRFLGFVIDYIANVGFAMVFMIAIQIASVMTTGEVEEMARETRGSELRSRLLGTLCLFFYYMVFEGFFSRTIGKMVTGTIVVDEDGFPPSFGQILGRTLARFIPFDPLSYLGSRTRGWHDSLSGTYVVMRRRKTRASEL